MEWQTNAAQINPIFFLVYNLLGAVVILTLFVSIIIGNFSSKKGEYVPGRDQASRSVARSATYSVLSKTALGGVIDLSTVCRAYDPSRAPQRETPRTTLKLNPSCAPAPTKAAHGTTRKRPCGNNSTVSPPTPPQSQCSTVRRAGAATSSRPTRDPWTAPVTQTTPARSASQAPPLPPQQSQSFRGEEATAAPPSANEWMANYDPWTSGGDENQNYDQQQSQKQFEPEKKREAPSSIRGGLSPFPTKDLQTFLMSAGPRKPLAASRANAHSAAPTELPVEFNYFLHSETVDWTSSGPTNPSQNSFSPSQNLVTPTHERSAPRSAAPGSSSASSPP
ncbi:hypothetical protein B0H14DRAFT_2652841 [Mycena olivaceomarginata]|nr:hypothetical protein B0H14DRAFT_2652841 [Mycena olivaceomarginata]